VFEPGEYELVDFGDGRKLERFGAELLDRPSPAAEGTAIANPTSWETASARFDIVRGSGGGGRGEWEGVVGEEWSIRHGESRLLLQLGPSGNIGVFPEQAGNWDWIAQQVRERASALTADRPRVLNLFAYTGGASLAAAVAGAEVTHVDSSGPTVASARRNADAAGLADVPIRWLVEDAMKFVSRECRRGNRYDGIVADPPTYGHGPKGGPFKFRQHLDELMERCGELLGAADSTGPTGQFLLFSCHAPGFGPDDAFTTVTGVLPGSDGRVTAEPLTLDCADGRQLAAGVSARWTSLH